MGQGEDLPPVSTQARARWKPVTFPSKQCLPLTHGSCVGSARCPNILLLLSGKTTFSSGGTTAFETKPDLLLHPSGKRSDGILEEPWEKTRGGGGGALV